MAGLLVQVGAVGLGVSAPATSCAAALGLRVGALRSD